MREREQGGGGGGGRPERNIERHTKVSERNCGKFPLTQHVPMFVVSNEELGRRRRLAQLVVHIQLRDRAAKSATSTTLPQKHLHL